MAAVAQIELAWRAGGWAVAWKVAGVPVTDNDSAEDGQEADGGKAVGGKATGRGGRPPPENVCVWASKRLDGTWHPAAGLGAASAGLVLLARRCPERFVAPVRGEYAVLVAPCEVPPGATLAESGAPEVAALWEPLELFGGVDDEARVVQEGPSGHFGRLALVQFDVPLTGTQAFTPLALVLELQKMGIMTVQLCGPRGSDMRRPQLQLQEATQADVLPGTCLALVTLRLPAEALASSVRTGRATQGFAGIVEHAMPGRFDKVLAAESALAEQRRPAVEGMVAFRGLEFFVPEEQLRPRAASSPLVDAALAALGRSTQGARILDLGVGCGALLLSILHSLGDGASGTGVDIDAGALQTCRANASRLLGPESAARVDAVLADFGQLHTPAVRSQLAAQGYDLIVCNPPYRSEAQQEAYNAATGNFGGRSEHAKTLVAGETGLELYGAVAASLAREAAGAQEAPGTSPLLRPGGTLLFQVEAGGRGRAGGAAARVGDAVERAAGGRLRVRGVHADEHGLERAILVELVQGHRR